MAKSHGDHLLIPTELVREEGKEPRQQRHRFSHRPRRQRGRGGRGATGDCPTIRPGRKGAVVCSGLGPQAAQEPPALAEEDGHEAPSKSGREAFQLTREAAGVGPLAHEPRELKWPRVMLHATRQQRALPDGTQTLVEGHLHDDRRPNPIRDRPERQGSPHAQDGLPGVQRRVEPPPLPEGPVLLQVPPQAQHRTARGQAQPVLLSQQGLLWPGRKLLLGRLAELHDHVHVATRQRCTIEPGTYEVHVCCTVAEGKRDLLLHCPTQGVSLKSFLSGILGSLETGHGHELLEGRRHVRLELQG
mmetsp:Transcript_33402/g.99492  ORF Transcript_33402/g.99492 Transcript_33402/m.99492 type:complete len:302 (+) Transcript_33402:321-1226(+)